MDNKILFINASLRDNSRTAELSRCLIECLDGKVDEIDLYREKLLPLGENDLILTLGAGNVAKLAGMLVNKNE